MMTSVKTIIMIANMKAAAMVEAIFSIAPSTLNIPSSKIHLPRGVYLAGCGGPRLAFIGPEWRPRLRRIP
jgi:hypothetical protein